MSWPRTRARRRGKDEGRLGLVLAGRIAGPGVDEGRCRCSRSLHVVPRELVVGIASADVRTKQPTKHSHQETLRRSRSGQP